MTISDYSDALLPEGREVFGVRLLPLCIGHALLLHRVRSPLVCGRAELRSASSDHPSRAQRGPTLPGLGDLLLALEICRQPGVQIPSRARMRWLGVRQIRFTSAQKLRLEGEFLDACLAFRAHWRDAFSRMPGIWQDDKEDADRGVPGLVGLKLGLMARLGVSEPQALATPIARAVYDLCAHAATEGHLKLYTAEEEEMMAAVRSSKLRDGELRVESPEGRQNPPPARNPNPAPAALLATALRAATSPKPKPAPVSIAPVPHGLRPAPEQPATEQAQRPGNRTDSQQRQPEGHSHQASQSDEQERLHTRTVA